MSARMARLLKAYDLSSQQSLVHQSQPEAISAGFTSVCISYCLQGCVWYIGGRPEGVKHSKSQVFVNLRGTVFKHLVLMPCMYRTRQLCTSKYYHSDLLWLPKDIKCHCAVISEAVTWCCTLVCTDLGKCIVWLLKIFYECLRNSWLHACMRKFVLPREESRGGLIQWHHWLWRSRDRPPLESSVLYMKSCSLPLSTLPSCLRPNVVLWLVN